MSGPWYNVFAQWLLLERIVFLLYQKQNSLFFDREIPVMPHKNLSTLG